ncbi:MAG: hypothetical protein IT428_14690 [Planctomycetaceae bacterium]|nr:hypothetical protein [Planctomycetaceae bacterium]
MPYYERQHFSRGLLIGLFFVALAASGIALVATVRVGELWLSAVIISVAMLPSLLGFLLRLETRVEDGVLSVRLTPFRPRRIALSDVVRAEVRTYHPIREYGGWGIRWGRGGMAYNARGNQGVQLELKDGRRVLIGSQEPERLLAAVRAGG